jgi:hypothetical protein
MRRLPLLFATLLLGACGTATGTQNLPASSGPTEATPTNPAETKPNLSPPPIVLVTAAGKQVAVAGSSCVTRTDPDTGESSGVCADSTWPHPEKVSVVRPGDSVSVALSGALVDEGSSVEVLPLGCEHDVLRTIDLEPGKQSTAFPVDLEPGAYELYVAARFEAEDGRSGDTSGSAGLLVDENAPLAVGPAPPGRSNC